MFLHKAGAKHQNMPSCIKLHANATYAFYQGVLARVLGMGKEDDIGYIQCPDPGRPYTEGGTIIFQLKRELISRSEL